MPDNVTSLPDNITRIRQLAQKWKRNVTNSELVELMDYVLREGNAECEDCKALRLANRRRQAEFRARRLNARAS